MALLKVLRGQIWLADFEPQAHKEEPGKRGRPALVMQTNILKEAGHATAIVIPGTTAIYRDAGGDGYPLRVGLGKVGQSKADTHRLIDQIRTISNHRLMGGKPVAELTRPQMKRVEEALRLLTGGSLFIKPQPTRHQAYQAKLPARQRVAPPAMRLATRL